MSNHPAGTSTSIPGPDDITRLQLDNGIILLQHENMQSPSVFISGYLGGGSMFDPLDKLGLALFTSQALMHGTEQHTHQEIYDCLESTGASLGLGASTHSTTFAGRSLAEDLPLLLNTLAECLRFPVFPDQELELLRAQMLTSLAIRAQDTEEQSALAFEELLYAGHPYGRPEDGHVHTVSTLSRADATAFHCQHYHPNGMVIAVVGAVSCQQVQEVLKSSFDGWEMGQVESPVFPALKPPAEAVHRHITLADKHQTNLVIGTLGPARKSQDYPAAVLGNHILGQFGMMGRIGESVRERTGLAYYAGSILNAGMLGGSWEVSAGVNPDNLRRAEALILEELRRFTQELVSETELADSVSNLVGLLPLSLETNAGVASALVRLERYDLGLDYLRKYADTLREITPQQVLQAAQRYIDPDRLVITSAGPELPVEVK